MATAKVFKSGNSQAIRLPREFRFNSAEVEITRAGNGIFLIEKQSKPQTGAALYEALISGPGFTSDFELPADSADLSDLKMQQIVDAFREPEKTLPAKKVPIPRKRKSK